jgi:hypothetical protein
MAPISKQQKKQKRLVEPKTKKNILLLAFIMLPLKLHLKANVQWEKLKIITKKNAYNE